MAGGQEAAIDVGQTLEIVGLISIGKGSDSTGVIKFILKSNNKINRA